MMTPDSHEAGKRYGDFASEKLAERKAPACECPTRKELDMLRAAMVKVADELADHAEGLSMAAQVIVKLEAERDSLRAKYTEAGGLILELERQSGNQQRGCAEEIAALVEQRDSLRAELATARKQIADDAGTLEYRSAVIETQNERARRDESRIEALRAELVTARARVDAAESTLAASADLANSWARESGVWESPDTSGLRDLIDRLWSKWSVEVFGLRARVETLEAALRPFAEAETKCCDWNRTHPEMAHDPAMPYEYVNHLHFRGGAAALKEGK